MSEKNINEYTVSEVNIHNKITDCWIIINSRVYNVTNYIEDHPGGQDKILEFAGKDASEAFEHVNHSSNAYNILDKYFIGRIKGSSVDISQKKNETTVINRLFTQEDKIGPISHIHKILGILVLLHFIFRYCKIVYSKINGEIDWNGGFDTSFYTLLFILLHTLLSYSSLIFNLPSKQSAKPMMWQEFRGHNIAFTTRSILVFITIWLSMRYDLKKYTPFINGIIVLSCFYVADMVTDYFKTEIRETTTRTMPYWDDCSYFTETCFKTYYMFVQFQASLVCLNYDHLLPSFNLLIPLQVVSFLLTLVRKNIISAKMYHIIYWSTLFFPTLIFYNYYRFFEAIIILPIIMLLLRKYLLINKYSLWIPIIFYNCTQNLLLSLIVFICSLFIFKRSPERKSDFLYHKNQKREVKLFYKKRLTHDTWELTFTIPEQEKLGIQLGEHIICYMPDPTSNNEMIKRKYTPISNDNGYFKLAIKEYKPTSEYPSGGLMSQYLAGLVFGDSLLISGPSGHNIFVGKGTFLNQDSRIQNKNVSMICAGTGITPIYSILNKIMEEKDSECLVNLLYVNKTQHDIMMKDELDKLKKENSDNLNIYYCCTREKNSNYICKRPDKDVLEKTVYNKDGNTTYLLCGPTHFVNTVNNILRNLSVNPHNILIF